MYPIFTGNTHMYDNQVWYPYKYRRCSTVFKL